MLKEYFFSDWDDNYPDVEFDISGDKYNTLITTCFKYCKYFSLDFTKENIYVSEHISSCEYSPNISDELKHIYGIDGSSEIIWMDKEGKICCREPRWKRKYYLCDECTKKFLLGFGSVFSYFKENVQILPENLVLYRSDNTVMLKVITHEGECSLYPHEGECLEDILKNSQWLEKT